MASHADGRRAREPEVEARARLEALFAGFDRLTPDELARIGLERRDDEHRQEMLRVVAAAAKAADRTALVGEARSRARETVLRRYRDGALHPTWVGLNWGISQGTISDRVAIIEALEDAAEAAVVEDLVDREVVASLSLDATQILGMAAGEVSEGSLARVLSPPPPGYRDTRWRWAGVALAALVIGAVALAAGGWLLGVGAGVAFAVVAAGVVVSMARRDPGDSAAPAGADDAGRPT
jgi:hypothetical protein